jgi:hypothetical protein
VIVTAASTPGLLREAAKSLAVRLEGSETAEADTARTPPHIGDPERVAEVALELAR